MDGEGGGFTMTCAPFSPVQGPDPDLGRAAGDSDNLFLSNDDYQLIQRYADKLDKRLNVIIANIKTL